MNYRRSALAAVAALVSFELFTANTPITTVQSVYAQDLSSSLQFKVKKMATNINKARKSLASQSATLAGDAFKLRQFGQRVDGFANGLKKYPANTDPAFLAATAELKALQEEFAAVKSGGGTSAAAPAQASATSTTEQAPAAPTPAAPTAASALDSSAKIKLNALVNNMERTRKQILNNGTTSLQTPEGVAKVKKTLGEYAATLGTYKNFPKDPAVQPAIQGYQALVATVQDTFAKAKQAKTAGDGVQAQLAALDKAMRANKAPKSLLLPFTEEEAIQWVKRTREVQATAERVMAEVNEIGGKHPLPIVQGTVDQGTPYDKQDVQRLFSNSQMQIRRNNEAIEETKRNLDAAFGFQHDLDVHRNRDPENSQHVAMMLRDGAEAQTYEQFDRLLRDANSHAFFDKATTGKVSAEKQARIDEVMALRKAYGEMRIKAIGESKLPEPKSADAKRLKIAEEILAIPRYEFGEHGPIVLTSEDITSRTKTVTRETIKDVDVSLSGDITWSGTRETWNYDWDEYTIATPIKDQSGDWYIWWIKPTFYRSGASTTPLNQWISGSATKGSLILEENFR